mmetsp:Transcript_2348/g.6244  ORF Transcript_2348/g.6244 Transcript_2348/m.6244 type:complete len:201 (+) Transcript_2348:250-852(+)
MRSNGGCLTRLARPSTCCARMRGRCRPRANRRDRRTSCLPVATPCSGWRPEPGWRPGPGRRARVSGLAPTPPRVPDGPFACRTTRRTSSRPPRYRCRRRPRARGLTPHPGSARTRRTRRRRRRHHHRWPGEPTRSRCRRCHPPRRCARSHRWARPRDRPRLRPGRCRPQLSRCALTNSLGRQALHGRLPTRNTRLGQQLG